MGKNRLRGGIGNAPAGRGGLADQLFGAREGARPLDRIMDESDPTRVIARENRGRETFQTIGESLSQGMGIKPGDNNRKKQLYGTVEAMLQVMQEASSPLDPLDAGATANVVRAYSDAYRSLPPEQRAVLQSIADSMPPVKNPLFDPSNPDDPANPQFVPADLEGFFGGQSLATRTPSAGTPGLRQARSAMLDRILNESDYYDTMGGSGRAYGNTSIGREQDRILGSLIGEYDLNPADVADAQFSDLAVPPSIFPAYRDRGDFPLAERLSTYTDGRGVEGYRFGKYAGDSARYDTRPDEGRMAQEYRLTDGGADFYPLAMNPNTGRAYQSPTGGPAYLTNNTDTDRLVALQMASEQQKVLDEIHNRIWGFTESAAGFDDAGRGARVRSTQMQADDPLTQVQTPLDLRRIAPWAFSQTDQDVGGVIKKAPFTAEQITDTILSQSGYGAEAPPYVRQIAKERLLPQVEAALQTQSGPGQVFDRTNAGMQMLRAAGAEELAPPPPRGPSAEETKAAIEALRRSGPRRPPEQTDLGMDATMHLPAYAREMMPNRMRAALLT